MKKFISNFISKNINKTDKDSEKINCVDVLDDGIKLNGHILKFPLSYDKIKAELGEAKIHTYGKNNDNISYIYDDIGIRFGGSINYLSELKKKKAYIDDEHNIIEVTLYVTGRNIYESFLSVMPEKKYIGNITFLGQKMNQEKLFKTFGGYTYSHSYQNEQGEKNDIHIATSVYVNNYDVLQSNVKYEGALYKGDCFLHDINLTFKPERPKSNENYNIVITDEDCLSFDTFNFKLAVVNELMYNQEVLKPYFDIFDYMAFKKANWNLETSKNVRAAVNFFKDLPVPCSIAELVTEIKMDGDNEIYMQIAPEWDGRDERFSFYKLTEAELKQFKNLKKIQILGNEKDATALKKICEPLGIEVEPLVP